MKKVFWIASYPKSGNTWMRYILTHLFFDISQQENVGQQVVQLAPGIYSKDFNINNAPEVTLRDGQKVSLLKTHARRPKYPNVETVGFLYIYRHPLDVLLSAINYSYIQKKSGFFHDGLLHTVEELKSMDCLDLYVESFMEDLNISYYEKMSGSWIDNVETWKIYSTEAYTNSSYIFKYEDLLNDSISQLKRLKPFFSVTDESLKNSLDFANHHTNDGGKFFWKKKAKNYLEYFSHDVVKTFHEKHAEVLTSLGYE